MAFDVIVRGLREAVVFLDRMAEEARAAAATKVTVGSPLPYAKYVTQGTRPHVIYPRDKQALFWAGAAHPVRMVHHPGTKPNPFISDAEDAMILPVIAAIAKGVLKAEPGSGAEAMYTAGLLVLAEARRRAPVKKGTLRDSLHVERL
jgi:hypothetical protein